MGSKNTQKSQQDTRSTTNWGYFTPPDTPDIKKLRDAEFEIDPSIPYRFGAERNRVKESLDNPIGGYYTPQMRDAIIRSRGGDLMQQEGQAYREGAYDVNRLNYARNLATAGMTAPQLAQTGSTSSGTGQIQQSGSPWGTIVGVGTGIGAAAAQASL